jgi:hypothetical protein
LGGALTDSLFLHQQGPGSPRSSPAPHPVADVRVPQPLVSPRFTALRSPVCISQQVIIAYSREYWYHPTNGIAYVVSSEYVIASLCLVSFYCFVTKHAREGLAQPQAWNAGDACAAPCLQGRQARQPERHACGKPGLQKFERMHIIY